MKSLRITALLLSLVFPGAWADSNTVASANILGYTKKNLPANGLIMVSNPFVNSDKNDMTINEIFGTSLPDGTTLYVYDNGYSSYSYIDGIGWVDDFFSIADDFEFTVGCGFWYLTSTAHQWIEQKPYSDF